MENASSILLLDYLVLSQNENTFIRRFGSRTWNNCVTLKQ